MSEFMRSFWYEEEGIETLEVLMIIAIIVVIAVLFRNQITTWVTSLINKGTTEIDKITTDN